MTNAFSKSTGIQVLLSLLLLLFGVMAIYLMRRAHPEPAQVSPPDFSDGSDNVGARRAKKDQGRIYVPRLDTRTTAAQDSLESIPVPHASRPPADLAKKLEKLRYEGYMKVGDMKIAWLSDGKGRIAVGEGSTLDDGMRIDEIHENFLLVSDANGSVIQRIPFTRSPDKQNSKLPLSTAVAAKNIGIGSGSRDRSEHEDSQVTAILIEPTLKAVKSTGETFTVQVKINNGSDIFAVPFDINYDPSILEVIGLYESSYLKKDGGQTTFLTSIDKDKGKITIGLTRLGRIGGVSGSGTLMSITFKALKKGSTSLLFANGKPMDSRLDVLPIEFVSGEVKVE